MIIQETAVELIFAAHSTTASASTSLILQLMRHSEVAERARAEVDAEGLIAEAPGSCCFCGNENSNTENSEAEKCTNYKTRPGLQPKPLLDKTACADRQESHRSWINVPYLSLEKLNQLRFLDCVVKELLRFLPPVSGGYRTVLQTFELNVSRQTWNRFEKEESIEVNIIKTIP